MKILHISPSCYPAGFYGGPNIAVYRIAALTASLGHTVTVATTDANGPRRLTREEIDRAEFRELNINYFRRWAGEFSPSLWLRLPKLVLDSEFVVLSAVYSNTTIPALLLARLFGKSVAWMPHGALNPAGRNRRWCIKKAFELVCRLLMPRQITLLCSSSNEADGAEMVFPPVRAHVIPFMIPAEPDHLPVPLAPPFRILYLGRLDRIKGIERLIDAMALIARTSKNIEWRLIIAGDGDAAYVHQLKTLVADAGLSDRIEFVGYVKEEDRSALIGSCHFAVLPSYSENFAMVVGEVLAAGRPMVVSRGAPWAEVEKVGCGQWVDNDARSISVAILSMFSAPINQMGLRGRQWISTAFSSQEVSRQWNEFLR